MEKLSTQNSVTGGKNVRFFLCIFICCFMWVCSANVWASAFVHNFDMLGNGYQQHLQSSQNACVFEEAGGTKYWTAAKNTWAEIIYKYDLSFQMGKAEVFAKLYVDTISDPNAKAYLDVSADGSTWHQVEEGSSTTFGLIDVSPYLSGSTTAYVRIRLYQEKDLCLDGYGGAQLARSVPGSESWMADWQTPNVYEFRADPMATFVHNFDMLGDGYKQYLVYDNTQPPGNGSNPANAYIWNEYSGKKYWSSWGGEASIVYKYDLPFTIVSAKVFGKLNVATDADPNAYAYLEVSPDGETWYQVEAGTNTTSGLIDVTPYLAGSGTAYVRVRLYQAVNTYSSGFAAAQFAVSVPGADSWMTDWQAPNVYEFQASSKMPQPGFKDNFDMNDGYLTYLDSSQNGSVFTEYGGTKYWTATQGTWSQIVYKYDLPFSAVRAGVFGKLYVDTANDPNAQAYIDVSPDGNTWTTVETGANTSFNLIDVSEALTGARAAYIRARLYQEKDLSVCGFGGAQFARSVPGEYDIDMHARAPYVFEFQAEPLPGDANGDGCVDVGDLGVLSANYGQSGKKWSQGDFNDDGIVDVGDLGILSANYDKQIADFSQSTNVVSSMYQFDTRSYLTLQSNTFHRISMARNERESLVVLYRNRTSSTGSNSYHITAAGAISPAVEIRRLVEAGGYPDKAELCGPNDTLVIDDNKTVGFLVTVDSRGLLSGEYTVNVVLTPTNSNLSQVTVTIPVKVYDVTLPDDVSVAVYCWDYDSILHPVWREFCLDLHVNTFTFDHLPVAPSVDFSELINGVTLLKQRMGTKRFQLQLSAGFVRPAGGWKPEFNAWLDALVSTMQGLGLAYSDWCLHIYDEDFSPAFLASAQAIKQHNPNVRIFSDWIVSDPQVISQFAPYVDIWCPPIQYLVMPGFEPSLTVMRNSGHPIYTYRCDPLPSQPLWEYRREPWLVWKYDLQGASFWTVRPIGMDGNFYGNYQDANGNPIPSRRFLQWRDGWDDYLLLTVAAQVAQTDSQLQATLNNLVQLMAIQKDDSRIGEILEQGRDKILHQLSN